MVEKQFGDIALWIVNMQLRANLITFNNWLCFKAENAIVSEISKLTIYTRVQFFTSEHRQILRSW